MSTLEQRYRGRQVQARGRDRGCLHWNRERGRQAQDRRRDRGCLHWNREGREMYADTMEIQASVHSWTKGQGREAVVAKHERTGSEARDSEVRGTRKKRQGVQERKRQKVQGYKKERGRERRQRGSRCKKEKHSYRRYKSTRKIEVELQER